MKQNLTLIFLLGFMNLFAQVPFYDAMNLEKHSTLDRGLSIVTITLGSDNIKAIAEILSQYGAIRQNATQRELKDDIEKMFAGNPFITITTKTQSGFKLGNTTANLDNIGAIPGKVAGLDVTNIVRGISMFMIDRAKKELTATFFNRLQTYFDKTTEIKVLFPKTSSALTGLLSYHYSEMLPALRDNFYEDVKLLPIHFDDVLMLPKYKDLLRDIPELRIAIKTIRLVNKLEGENVHCSEIIQQFAEFSEWEEKPDSRDFQNFGNSLKLAAIFSNSLRYRDASSRSSTNRAWVTSKEILELLEDEVTFRIYLGLLYEQLKKSDYDIKFYMEGSSSQTPATAFVENNQAVLFLIQNYISEFIDLAEKLENKIAAIKEIRSNKEKLSNEDLYEYINLSIDIIEYGTNAAKLFDNDFALDKYVSLARNSNELFKNIYQENYGAGIFNIVSIFEQIAEFVDEYDGYELLMSKINALRGDLSYDPTKIQEEIRNFDSKRNDKNLKKLISQLTSEIEKIETLTPAKQLSLQCIIELKAILVSKNEFSVFKEEVHYIRKYGLFIANIVEAETPEEVQSVIEAAALPVGSSALKKHSDFNISIQSYLGASYNFSVEDNPITAWDSRFNVTAPIGLSFSRGFSQGGSISGFVSLLDIGAIVDYELKRDSTITTSVNPSSGETMTTTINTTSDYKVELGQIFSPGVSVVYGFPFDIPVSLMVGCQYGPGLINIRSDEMDIIKPSFRWIASLTVDIPWFTIYNKAKIKKKK